MKVDDKSDSIEPPLNQVGMLFYEAEVKLYLS
jgi:hypothetical protein